MAVRLDRAGKALHLVLASELADHGPLGLGRLDPELVNEQAELRLDLVLVDVLSLCKDLLGDSFCDYGEIHTYISTI